jgi:Polyketide cyclase / dehydrase and lipid transport
MIWYVVVAVVLLLVVFAMVAVMQPDEFRVSRSLSMKAPAAAPFAQVNDFHNWQRWSPWLKLDPAAKVTFDGAPAGKGAIYAWDGNKHVGAGRSTILESRPNELVRIQLDFRRPFRATNLAEFTFRPHGDQTDVSWTISGKKNNLMFKAMHMFMNMDKMIGSQFEQGLADMKAIVEASPNK